MVAVAKRGLSGSGGLCPFLWERPSADQVNNTVSVPPLPPTLTSTLNLCGNRAICLTIIKVMWLLPAVDHADPLASKANESIHE